MVSMSKSVASLWLGKEQSKDFLTTAFALLIDRRSEYVCLISETRTIYGNRAKM